VALIINFAGFQLGWFAAVLSAAALVPAVGAAVIAGVIALHLARAANPRAEFALLLLCGAVGGAWDSLLVAQGFVTYPSGNFAAGVAPYWIVMMWMLFATTLNVSMGWLKGRPLLAAGFGLVGGPLSYLAGQKLDGIVLVEPVSAMIALGVGWALMMPALLLLAERFNGIRAPNRTIAWATE
jgi:hypothetical protein